MLILDAIEKNYGDTRALGHVSVSLPESGYAVIVGQSGSGKTTLLRAIAGHIDIDSGRILLGDTDLTELPAHKRPVASVFQQFALFPHLSVAQNIGFGLEQRNESATAIRRQVGEMLDLVGLAGIEHRKPATLSGGQQQRVALARALAVKPSVVMLDEPLGALDPDLRHSMRRELKQIQRQSGVLFLHVSHDREEALTLADHLLVMHHGQLVGSGPLADLQADPGNHLVARVLGLDNLVPHERESKPMLAFAPEHVQLGSGEWTGVIISEQQIGAQLEREIRLASGQIIRQRLIADEATTLRGQSVYVAVPKEAVREVEIWEEHSLAES